MRQTRFPVTRYILIDSEGEKKEFYFYHEATRWMEENDLTEVRREPTRYSADYITTYIHVTNK